MTKKRLNKKIILLTSGILLIAIGALAYSQYGIEIGQFFAAEPVGTLRVTCLSHTNQYGVNSIYVDLSWSPAAGDSDNNDRVLWKQGNGNFDVIAVMKDKYRFLRTTEVAPNAINRYRIRYADGLESNTVKLTANAQTCGADGTPTPMPTPSPTPTPTGQPSQLTVRCEGGYANHRMVLTWTSFSGDSTGSDTVMRRNSVGSTTLTTQAANMPRTYTHYHVDPFSYPWSEYGGHAYFVVHSGAVFGNTGIVGIDANPTTCGGQ